MWGVGVLGFGAHVVDSVLVVALPPWAVPAAVVGRSALILATILFSWSAALLSASAALLSMEARRVPSHAGASVGARVADAGIVTGWVETRPSWMAFMTQTT